MRNLKLAAVTLGVILLGSQALAGGVGYINYQKVQNGYPLAQSAIKEIDAKALEIQQFMIDKEKQYKALSTPVQIQYFEETTSKELKAKEDALVKLRAQKEELIFNKIQTAAKQVLVEQKLDAIVDYRTIFVGGVDISDLVIQKLKSGQI